MKRKLVIGNRHIHSVKEDDSHGGKRSVVAINVHREKK